MNKKVKIEIGPIVSADDFGKPIPTHHYEFGRVREKPEIQYGEIFDLDFFYKIGIDDLFFTENKELIYDGMMMVTQTIIDRLKVIYEEYLNKKLFYAENVQLIWLYKWMEACSRYMVLPGFQVSWVIENENSELKNEKRGI